MFDSDAPDNVAFASAISEWRRALGDANVTTQREATLPASTATFSTSARVTAILKPGSRDDVQRCVRIANQFAVPLYPISTGRNWGYGSRVPIRDGVLLDLSRLNRILDFNEELAYVTLEPGVSQRQLHDFLHGQRSRLWMDATGSSPDCSVIGNTLERGFGHTPMGDHCSQACGFEVVLPTGDVIETGFCRFPAGKTGFLSRWGTGPSLDGLFSQSNFGIVTRMTVWLMPAPEYFQAFVFQSDKAIGPIVDALRPLRMNGTIRSVMHLGNDYKVLSGTGQYPWEAAGQKIPLSAEVLARLRRELRISQWNGSGALYGTRARVREARTLLRRALRGKVDRLRFVDERALRVLQRVEKPYRAITRRNDLGRTLKLLQPLMDVLRGVPTESFLSSAYWRKKSPVPAKMNPDDDNCGLLWCSPVAPNTGADVTEVTRLASEIVPKHGFEPIVSVSVINERVTVSTIAITYDREVPGEDERAMLCYRTLTDQLLQRGYPPYRLNVSSMDLGSPAGTYMDLLHRLKTALDPKGILSPGRYE
jgi:4-cresol dehydrogenase (hydroxylating)